MLPTFSCTFYSDFLALSPVALVNLRGISSCGAAGRAQLAKVPHNQRDRLARSKTVHCSGTSQSSIWVQLRVTTTRAPLKEPVRNRSILQGPPSHRRPMFCLIRCSAACLILLVLLQIWQNNWLVSYDGIFCNFINKK